MDSYVCTAHVPYFLSKESNEKKSVMNLKKHLTDILMYFYSQVIYSNATPMETNRLADFECASLKLIVFDYRSATLIRQIIKLRLTVNIC